MLNIYISLVLVEMSRLGLIEHRKSLNPFVFFKYRSLSSNEDDIFLPTYFCLFFGLQYTARGIQDIIQGQCKCSALRTGLVGMTSKIYLGSTFFNMVLSSPCIIW